MKKGLSLSIVAALVSMVCVYSSCSKSGGSTNPTPVNNQLSGMNKVISYPATTLGAGVTYTESYSFSYDGNGRISQILYSSNDPALVSINIGNQSIIFTYNADTIFRVATAVHVPIPVEHDTFILNAAGQITQAFMYNDVNHARTVYNNQYFGKLLATQSQTYGENNALDSNVTFTTSGTFTSNSGDITQFIPSPTLTANFYHVTTPLTVNWEYFTSATATATSTQNVSSASATFTDNTYYPVTVLATDGIGDVALGVYPGSYNGTTDYTVYNLQNNRTGDYLQIESFIKFGVNIYQNTHLVKTIINKIDSTSVAYTIDGQSKITETNLKLWDYLKGDYNISYQFTYTSN
jgi:hypothetical protein